MPRCARARCASPYFATSSDSTASSGRVTSANAAVAMVMSVAIAMDRSNIGPFLSCHLSEACALYQDGMAIDFKQGVAFSDIADGGMLAGEFEGEQVLVARRGDELYAIGATCTHYSGPLAEGLIVGDEVRCPWHHACFDLRTGEATRAPALAPVACYAVARRGDQVVI